MVLDILIFLAIMLALAIIGPLALGFFFWFWSRLRRKPLSFEDAVVKGYELVYPNPKKI